MSDDKTTYLVCGSVRAFRDWKYRNPDMRDKRVVLVQEYHHARGLGADTQVIILHDFHQIQTPDLMYALRRLPSENEWIYD